MKVDEVKLFMNANVVLLDVDTAVVHYSVRTNGVRFGSCVLRKRGS